MHHELERVRQGGVESSDEGEAVRRERTAPLDGARDRAIVKQFQKDAVSLDGVRERDAVNVDPLRPDHAGRQIGRPVEQGDVEPLTWELAARGNEVTAVQHLANVEFVHSLGRRLAEWWDTGFDLLLTPTQAAPPPPISTA